MSQPAFVRNQSARVAGNGVGRRERGVIRKRIDGCNAARPANFGSRSAVAKRQNIGAPGQRLPTPEEGNMRAIVIAAVVAAGVGLGIATPSYAAPVNGPAISKAATASKVVKRAHWRHHYRHHRSYRYSR